MSQKKSYLIIGPINKWGGVNLDVGFIAQSLVEKGHTAQVLSLGTYYEDSSVFDFISRESYTSVDREIAKNHTLTKVSLALLQAVKPLAIPKHHRVHNGLTNRFVDLKKARQRVIESYISRYDGVVIVSQLTREWNREIIETARSQGKKVFLRVTQQIHKRDLTPENISWLQQVTAFLHHSYNNLALVQDILTQSAHVCIDQCAYQEDHFLEVPLIKRSITNFYTISRLEKTKGLEEVITVFKSIINEKIQLTIYGDGRLSKQLQELTKDDSRIILAGAIPLSAIAQAHGSNDCLIINSSIEGGPYTAIEAMAAGKLIISRDVGAMTRRLGNEYPYILKDTTAASLKQAITEVLALKETAILQQSRHMRELYVEHYTYNKIADRYRQVLEA